MKKQKKKEQPRGGQPALGEVVDLFCGVGALSHGLFKSGFDIRAGYDTDRRCGYAFEKNNHSSFFARDVATLQSHEIAAHFSGKVPSVVAGCAPCQPFSSYKHRYDEDLRWDLVSTFADLAIKANPDYITMENVPTLLKYKGGRVFEDFKKILKDAGYYVMFQVAKCELFGVPQKRRRLVIVASRTQEPPELQPTQNGPKTVRQAIENLPHIAAGSASASDPLHVSASLSAKNLERIRISKPGGTWHDWPFELRAKCHQKASGRTYSGVYARMVWDQPSPTMTTQCYGFGNGRFGHPEQDRAISLREAAILQSFPHDYVFMPPNKTPTIAELGRWIGNAVPVGLAEAIGNCIQSLIEVESNDQSETG